MKYVLNEDGSIKVGANGHPMAVGDDGKEFEIDALGANERMTALSSEAKEHRLKASERGKKLEAFEGIDDPKAALEALKTVASFDEDKKTEIAKIKQGLEDSFNKAETGYKETITKLEGDLFEVNVLSKFGTSKTAQETILPADILSATFKHHFQKDGSAVDQNGNVIYSKEKPAQAAGFEEALTAIINQYPHRDSILKSKMEGGGGSQNANDGGNDNGGVTKSSTEKIKAGLQNLK